MNTFRAVLITGSPGIGKTTSAHLCAKLAGFTPIELNASDARSKKLVEVSSGYVILVTTCSWLSKNGMNVNNTSLDGFIKGAVSPRLECRPFFGTNTLFSKRIQLGWTSPTALASSWMKSMACLLVTGEVLVPSTSSFESPKYVLGRRHNPAT
jgi:ATPase family associated with various cellular activities (AAA)